MYYSSTLFRTRVFPRLHLAEVAEDFSLLEAQTADEALDMLDECRIDCVLSAYTLPESDGIELLRAVRGTRTDLPFVLYTESGSERIASEAISAGVSDYLRSEETDAETLAERAKQLVHPSDTNGTNQRFNHYRSIVQAMGDGVYTLDTNGYMTAVNDTLVDISGYERDELLGQQVSVLLAGEDVRRGDTPHQGPPRWQRRRWPVTGDTPHGRRADHPV